MLQDRYGFGNGDRSELEARFFSVRDGTECLGTMGVQEQDGQQSSDSDLEEWQSGYHDYQFDGGFNVAFESANGLSRTIEAPSGQE